MAAVNAPFITPHGLVRLGLSIGTAVGRLRDEPTDLVASADRHMYGVKTTRRAAQSPALPAPRAGRLS